MVPALVLVPGLVVALLAPLVVVARLPVGWATGGAPDGRADRDTVVLTGNVLVTC